LRFMRPNHMMCSTASWASPRGAEKGGRVLGLSKSTVRVSVVLRRTFPPASGLADHDHDFGLCLVVAAQH